MDNLNKQQVILIGLLIAIVTSMTTSIVTISLSDRSSAGASQTIYKVIQQTLDKVTPTDSPVRQIVDTAPAKTAPDELPLSDIATQAGKNILKIYLEDPVTGTDVPVSLGITLNNKGIILASTFASTTLADGAPIVAINSDGAKIPVAVQKSSPENGLVFLQTKNLADNKKLKPLTLTGFASSLSLGSNVVAFGTKGDKSVVSTGIVSEFDNFPGVTATSTASAIIATDVSLSSNQSGWLLFDTYGKVAGFLLPMTEDKIARFVDASLLKQISGFDF